jgi:hypothetical protein
VIVLLMLLAASGCFKGSDSQLPYGPGPSGPVPATPSGVKKAMAQLMNGPQSLMMIRKDLNQEAPSWDEISKKTKEFVENSKQLGTLKPPHGSAESWAKLTTEFAASASELDKAALAKDKPAAQTADRKLTTSCKGCHAEHKPKAGAVVVPAGAAIRPPG